MEKKSRGGRPVKTEFTFSESKCVVVTIQAVFDINDMNDEDVESALDTLRQHGAAEIVGRNTIAEGLDEADKILRKMSVSLSISV